MVSTQQPQATSNEIDSQISGYWISPRAEVPTRRPEYRPTGALLPRLGSNVDAEFLALDLVSIEYAWFPLSEAGRYTYSHSEGLLLGEQWRFAVWRGERLTIYQAAYADLLEPEQVAGLYGAEAALRCRSDRRAVQLRLVPVPPAGQ